MRLAESVRLVALFFAVSACAAPIEILKVGSIDEAAHANGTKLHAVAIIRGAGRAAVPADATIDAKKDGPEMRVPRPGVFTYALDANDSVVKDDHDRIIGVKSGVQVTKFIAGTATLDGSEVKGELEDHVERVALFPSDRVELRGTFAPGESVPTGGKVEITRAWSALAFGGAMLGGAWLPSVIVGAVSNVDANHWLFVPVVGPWIAFAVRDACTQTDSSVCFEDAGTRVALIADGIIQSTGAVLMLVGLPSSAEVRWTKQATIRIAPMFGNAGVSLSGTF